MCFCFYFLCDPCYSADNPINVQSVSFSPNINFNFTVYFAALFTFSAAFSSGTRYATTGLRTLTIISHNFSPLSALIVPALAYYLFLFVEWSSENLFDGVDFISFLFFSWFMTSWGFNHIFKTLLISKIYSLAFCFHSLSLNLTPMIQGRTYQDYSSLHALTPSSN